MNILFDSAVCTDLVLSLGHFVWQGLVIGAFVWLISLGLRRASPPARYRVYLTAMVVMSVCPMLTFLWLGRDAATPAGAQRPLTATEEAQTDSLERSDTTGADSLGFAASAPGRDELAIGGERFTTTAPSSGSAPPPATAANVMDWRRYAPWLTMVYLAGVLAMLVRLTLGLRGGQGLRRSSEPVMDPALLELLSGRADAMGLRFVPTLAWCRRIAVPTVVGVVRPAILLPISLTTGLAPDQLAAILTHELAHIRRWDPLVNVFQRIVEAVLFFHPMVWFVSRRIRQERENCCDDTVLSMGTDAVSYASSLLDIAERAATDRLSALAGLATLRADGRPSELSGRIRRLLRADEHEAMRLHRPGLMMIALAAVLMLGALSRLAVNAEQESPAETKQTPAMVTLPNGVMVELLGVTEDPDGERWWHADGEPLAEIPEISGRSRTFPDERSLARFFVLRAHNLPFESLHQVDVTPSKGGASASDRTKFGPLHIGSMHTIPNDVESVSVRLGFTSGEWETVCVLNRKGDVQDGASRGGVGAVRLTTADADVELTLQVPYEVDGEKVRYRAQIVDENGTAHSPIRTGASSHGDDLKLEYRYGLKREEIHEIRVEAVSFRYWVTFRNVSLQPGHHTDVEIEVEAPDQLSLNEFSDIIATQVAAHLRFANEKYRQQTATEFRDLVRKYAANQPSMEFVQSIRAAVDQQLKAEFPKAPDVDDPVIQDRYYINLPSAIRMLQWRLFMALRQQPLDVQQQVRLEEQREWIRRHLQSLPPPPAAFVRSGRSQETVLAELQSKMDDPLNPLFQNPLSDEQFKIFRETIREMDDGLGDHALLYAVPHIVSANMKARYGRRGASEIPAPELEGFDERPVGYGQTNGRLRVKFPSAETFRGMWNWISDDRDRGDMHLVDLTESRPTTRVFGGAPGKGATLDEIDRWFAENHYRGHLIFDEEEIRIVGVRGTRLVPLDQRRFFEVDGVPTQQLVEQVEQQGDRSWTLPEPVSRIGTSGESNYDSLAAVLTPDDRLFILQVQQYGAAGLRFHIRRHHPQSDGDIRAPEPTGDPTPPGRAEEPLGDIQLRELPSQSRYEQSEWVR